MNRVGESVFLHGGISSEFTGWSIEKINAGGKAEIQAFDRYKEYLIVVGHTPQSNGEIRRRFGGKAFLIDTGMLAGYTPGGKASALEISQGGIRAIYLTGQTELN